jgi:hypothetical protein
MSSRPAWVRPYLKKQTTTTTKKKTPNTNGQGYRSVEQDLESIPSITKKEKCNDAIGHIQAKSQIF